MPTPENLELFGHGHALYERMSIFQHRLEDAGVRDPAELLPVVLGATLLATNLDDNERFWWDVFSGLLSIALTQAGYPEPLRTTFLRLYQQVLPLLGPRPFATGEPQHFSPFGYDSTPIEISHSYDGSRSTIRFACDHYSPPGDTFAQTATEATLKKIAQKFGLINADFELFDAVAEKMWINPANRDGITEKYFPRDPRQPCPAHLCSAFDLLQDGSFTIKAYATTLVKSLEVGKTKNEIAGELIRWLDQSVYRSTPMLPAYATIEDYSQSCPTHLQQHVWQFGWDCVAPQDSRLKVYVYKEKTRLGTLRDMWTQGGRLTGPEIDKGLEVINELWLAVCLAPQDMHEDDELTNRHGMSQPVIMALEIRPGAPHPVPKLYFQPARFGHTDLDIARNLAHWFERRGWPLARTWVADTMQLLIHMDLSHSCSAHTFVSLSIKADCQVAATMYLNPTVFAAIFHTT
ncbi:tryptophan dimethylallyltransferase-domain-containing protein [Bombardia bombarda]|uniref:Tryptophan dimethylallyltransferase-domain-containing protein n=1 Tax=Bombardia bombarda TaxID=252184 RepID=A0AA39W9P9_9PEZI|nr:tryptophan dimethylallyltransferase-domain-containing protein [Bombardia bombarda]